MRGSLGERFQTEVNKCNVCFMSYDQRGKKPLIICSMHHTVCADCMRGIESNPKCPFCRETIDFRKIVINKYIFDLLPKQKQAGPSNQDNRGGIHQGQIERQFSAQNYVQTGNQQSISNNQYSQRQSESLHPQFSRNQISQNTQRSVPLTSQPRYRSNLNHMGSQRNERQREDEHESFEIDFNSLQLDRDRNIYYLLIFVVQVPFIIADLCFAVSNQQYECMDRPHQNPAYVLRTWLFANAYVGLFPIVVLGIAVMLRLCCSLSLERLKSIEYFCIIFLGIKVAIWICIELQFFKVTMIPYCTGGIFAYGVILTIIYSIIIAISAIIALATGKCIC